MPLTRRRRAGSGRGGTATSSAEVVDGVAAPDQLPLLRETSTLGLLLPRSRLPSDEPASVVRSRRWNADGPLFRPADAGHLHAVSTPIDVDVLRGLTFYSATAVNPWAVRALLTRVVLFPLFPRFWFHELVLVVVSNAIPGLASEWGLTCLPGFATEALGSVVLLCIAGLAYARANAARFPVDDYYDCSDDDSDTDGSDSSDSDGSLDSSDDGVGAAAGQRDAADGGEGTSPVITVSASAAAQARVQAVEAAPVAAQGGSADREGRGSGGDAESKGGGSLLESDPDEAATSTARAPAARSGGAVGAGPVKPRSLRDGAVIVKAKLWDKAGDMQKRVVSLRGCYAMITNKVALARQKHWSAHEAAVPYAAMAMALAPTAFRFNLQREALVSQAVADPWQLGPRLLTICTCGAGYSAIAAGVSGLCTLVLSYCFLRLLSGAERALHLRFLAAKFFTGVTSSRRAKRYGLPHFRLHKIANIKLWLSLRSALRRRGSRRSVDMVVSLSFLLALVLVTIIMVLQVSMEQPVLQAIDYCLCASWALVISVYLLRFLTLGTKINAKYKNDSLLLTEQINVHLRTFRFPHKKTELSAANSVLGLTTKLLKELEAPSTVSGLSMSPYLYHVTRVVVLSAFSAVLSDMLGFKLKVWKFKI